MERKLSQLFDRQKFQQNACLSAIIDDVESRYATTLTDDELDMVSAAGEKEFISDEVMLIIPPDPQEGKQA